MGSFFWGFASVSDCCDVGRFRLGSNRGMVMENNDAPWCDHWSS